MGTSPTPEGYIICGFGVAGTADKIPLLRSALAQLLLKRSHTILPGWLRVALPLVAAEKVSPTPASKLPLDALEKLEKAGLKGVAANPAAVESARGFASLLYAKGGAHALGQYVACQGDAAHQGDPAKGRQELDAFLRPKKR